MIESGRFERPPVDWTRLDLATEPKPNMVGGIRSQVRYLGRSDGGGVTDLILPRLLNVDYLSLLVLHTRGDARCNDHRACLGRSSF
jgi:hypothetical protein